MIDRRSFLKAGTLAAAGASLSLDSVASSSTRTRVALEWRNKQTDMAYRQLGRTGFMVSEFVNGGDPVSQKDTRQVEVAMERGLNYLDMAPAYGRGDPGR